MEQNDRINVLFLGGAKRVSMARLFKKSGASMGKSVEIYSYELEKHVPICIEAKVIVGKRWSDPDVYADLLRVCQQNNISVIVPFVDGAVAVAAEFVLRYPGVAFAPCGDVAMAERMFDKVVANDIFMQHQLPVPQPHIVGSPYNGLIAKPRHGSASKGIVEIDTDADMAKIEPEIDEYLVQERIDHRQEYTVDCYVSLITGEHLAIVPRKRKEVAGGEVTRTETVIFPEVYDLAKATLTSLGLRGAVTIQIIHDLDTDRVMLMEINPRLGGGAVCSVFAGVDLPGMILTEASGIAAKAACYRPNTEISRYTQEVVFFN